MDVWTTRSILEWIEGYLHAHGDEHAKLSAQWLVSDVLHCSRLELFADFDRPLSMEERNVLRDYTRRRAAGEPLQYITGTAAFRFLVLGIEPGVLIPRPETEVLVSEALAALAARVEEERLVAEQSSVDTSNDVPNDITDSEDTSHILDSPEPEPDPLLVVDLCTGSGNIACSIASELPHAHVFATDISSVACNLAQRNVDSLGLSDRVLVVQSNLAEAFPADQYGMVDLVISNPPYIPTSEIPVLANEVRDFEPTLALDGGMDGLSVYRDILRFALQALKQKGVLAVELHETCLDQAKQEALECGFSRVYLVNDLAGKPRVLVAIW